MDQGGNMHFPAPFIRSLIRLAALAILTTGGIGVARAEIRIAAVGPMSVTPMTGQYAMFGEQLMRGAEMAVRDINAEGGINGQKLSLQIADDACDPKQASAIAEELASRGVIFVDGHFCSGASIAASRIYNEKGILQITPASINSKLTEQGFRNVFRVCGRDDTQATFAANYVLDNGLAGRIAIVQDQSAFSKGIADEFKKQLNKRGVQEVMNEEIAQGDKDFSTLITRMIKNTIQLIYFAGYHTEGGLFVRHAREQGMNATMMVTSAMANREYWDLAGPGGEGTLMIFAPDPRKLPTAAEVVKRFEAEGYSPEGYTLYAYAAIQVFAGAARKASSTELEALAKALHDGTYETVVGSIKFDDKGDVAGFKYKMYRWNDGSYEEICCERAGEE
jgi:branched-chain amino acid transport system substrate-binding protein